MGAVGVPGYWSYSDGLDTLAKTYRPWRDQPEIRPLRETLVNRPPMDLAGKSQGEGDWSISGQLCQSGSVSA